MENEPEPIMLCPVTLDECEDPSMKRSQRCPDCDVVKDCGVTEDSEDPTGNYKDINKGDRVYYVSQDAGIRCAEVISVDLAKELVEVEEMPHRDHGFMPYPLVFKDIDECIEWELAAYREYLEQAAVDCPQEFEEASDVPVQ